MSSKTPSANVSKLKLHLGKYLAMVKRGKEVIVLDRSTPVARLVPYADDAPDPLIVKAATEDTSVFVELRLPPVEGSPTDSLAELLKERQERVR